MNGLHGAALALDHVVHAGRMDAPEERDTVCGLAQAMKVLATIVRNRVE